MRGDCLKGKWELALVRNEQRDIRKQCLDALGSWLYRFEMDKEGSTEEWGLGVGVCVGQTCQMGTTGLDQKRGDEKAKTGAAGRGWVEG